MHDGTATGRKLAALPDPEVVYQIVEVWSGNIEVQAECFYDLESESFTHRQLGKHFLVTETHLRPHPSVLADFPLHVALLQVSEEQLAGAYNTANLPVATRNRTAFTDDRRLLFAGVMTISDLRALLAIVNEQDRTRVQQLYDGWYSTEPVSTAVADLPGQLNRVIDFVPTNTLSIVWEGPSGDDAAALGALPGDSGFTGAIATIVQKAAGVPAGTFTIVEIPVGPEQIPPELEQKVEFARTADLRHYTMIGWQGSMTSDDMAALRRWAAFPEFSQAVEALIAALQGFTIAVDLPAEARRPTQAELPAVLQAVLHIQPTVLTYKGPKANDEQMAALQALQTLGDAPFQAAVAAIIAANQAADDDGVNLSRQFPPENLRPTNESLPEGLRDNLKVEPLKLTWRGYPATDSQIQLLQSLLHSGDDPFRNAIASIMNDVQATITVPFAVDVRPTQAHLTGALAEKLLLATTLMRYHGIMTRDDPTTLLPVYPGRPDQQALRRLHATTQRSGLRGRDLMIRARRGSAIPSELRPIEPDVF